MGGPVQGVVYDALTSAESIARRSPIQRYLNMYRRAQWWDPEETARYRDAKVAALVRHAYETTAFYRARMDEAGVRPEHVTSVADLGRIPVLTRGDVAGHAREMVSTAFRPAQLESGSSSGSTGEPVRYWHDRRSLGAGCAAERWGWEMAGWRAGDRCVLVWGHPYTVEEEWTRLGPRVKTRLFRELRVPICDLRDGAVAKETLDALERFRPRWIRGYANSIAFLAKHALQDGRSFPSCRGVLPTAEATTDASRELMERVFGKVFDGYGSSEIPGVAHQCAEGAYHIVEPHVVVEYEEQLCEDGGCEVILTNLDEYGMPLIRYRIGDVVVPGDATPCACGRHWSTLRAVHGRRSDIIETPSGGALLVPDFFGAILTRTFPDLVQYQVAKTAADRLEIRVMGPCPYEAGRLREIEDALRPHLGADWTIEAVDSPALGLTSGGKVRLVVDETAEEDRTSLAR